MNHEASQYLTHIRSPKYKYSKEQNKRKIIGNNEIDISQGRRGPWRDRGVREVEQMKRIECIMFM